jgi:hypothetical protein
MDHAYISRIHSVGGGRGRGEVRRLRKGYVSVAGAVWVCGGSASAGRRLGEWRGVVVVVVVVVEVVCLRLRP